MGKGSLLFLSVSSIPRLPCCLPGLPAAFETLSAASKALSAANDALSAASEVLSTAFENLSTTSEAYFGQSPRRVFPIVVRHHIDIIFLCHVL